MRDEFYDEFTTLVDWHWWYIGRKKIVLKQIKKYFNTEGASILDIGCGPGGMLNDLQAFGKVFGIDSSFKSIKFCREKSYLNTCNSNVENLPFEDSSFSAVLMLDVLEHVNNDKEVLDEAVRVCKPGGLIFLTVPAFQFLWGNIDIVTHHKRRYTVNDLKMLAETSGLHIVKASYFNFFLFPFIAAVRIMERFMFKKFQGEAPVKSDFAFNKPGIVNQLLAAVFAVESRLLSSFDFPVGVSIIFLLRKAA